MAYIPSKQLVARWEAEVMAKTHTLRPGDKVTLNTSIMARSLVSHCRYLGIIDQPGVVLAVSGQRVYVEWRDALFLGWFDADALTAEVVQPGLGL